MIACGGVPELKQSHLGSSLGFVNKEVINNQLNQNSRHAFCWKRGKSGCGSSSSTVPTLLLWLQGVDLGWCLITLWLFCRDIPT